MRKIYRANTATYKWKVFEANHEGREMGKYHNCPVRGIDSSGDLGIQKSEYACKCCFKDIASAREYCLHCQPLYYY